MTTYRIIENKADYRKAHKFVRDTNGEDYDGPMTFPTVLAERDGEIVGVMSTRIQHSAIMAGSIAASSAFILKRLFEFYETALDQLKIKIYLIPVAKEAKLLLKVMGNVFGPSWQEDENHIWYKREVPSHVNN